MLTLWASSWAQKRSIPYRVMTSHLNINTKQVSEFWHIFCIVLANFWIRAFKRLNGQQIIYQVFIKIKIWILSCTFQFSKEGIHMHVFYLRYFPIFWYGTLLLKEINTVWIWPWPSSPLNLQNTISLGLS